MIKVNEDYEELKMLVESCAYFVKKYKSVLKAEERRREEIKKLQEDVTKWLETARPGDKYTVPKLRLKKEDIAITLYKIKGLRMYSKMSHGKYCYIWSKSNTDEEKLPF